MEILFASGNKHKQKEMAEIFAPHTIVIPADLNLKFDPEETGASFVENSLIKAKALWLLTGKPALADDSGISVDCLEGLPGIHSARYRGRFETLDLNQPEKIVQLQKNTLLIEHAHQVMDEKKLDKTNPKNWTCRFVCAMTLYLGAEQFYCIQQTLEGRLVTSLAEAKGSDGFGYDPVVFLPEFNKTVAELTPPEKNAVSHRAKAGKVMLTMVNQLG